MLTGLNHLTLAVTDLERSFAFYRDLLGFRPSAIWNTGAYLSLGELWLCLSLLEAGVTEWRQNKSEGDSFYFLDPDGHQLEAHVGNLASRLTQCREAPYAGMRFFE